MPNFVCNKVRSWVAQPRRPRAERWRLSHLSGDNLQVLLSIKACFFPRAATKASAGPAAVSKRQENNEGVSSGKFDQTNALLTCGVGELEA